MSEEASFESVKTRLDEIVDAVGDEDISLDAALDLYEEAVKLGMQASSLLEEGIVGETDDAASGDVVSDDAAPGDAISDDTASGDVAQSETNRDGAESESDSESGEAVTPGV